MDRRGAWGAIAAVAIGVLLAMVTTSGGVGMWGEPQWTLPEVEPEAEEAPLLVEVEEPLFDEETSSDPIEVPRWITAIVQAVLVALAFIGAFFLARAGWRNRPRVKWRRQRAGDGEFDVLPDVAAAVVDQAAAQRAALFDGAPRNAIVQCWLRLERDVADAGLRRDPADTSLEFTERVLAGYSVDPEAITDLAARYREARFSDHPLTEADRDAALAALDRLHRSLEPARIEANA